MHRLDSGRAAALRSAANLLIFKFSSRRVTYMYVCMHACMCVGARRSGMFPEDLVYIGYVALGFGRAQAYSTRGSPLPILRVVYYLFIACP